MSLDLRAWLTGLVPADLLPALSLGGVTLDSRRVRPGDLFVAVPGHSGDGRDYLADAAARGAVAALQPGVVPAARQQADGFWLVDVPDLTAQLGRLAALFHNDPSADLTMVAVTGTNGKTTVSTLVAQALGLLGSPAGVCGTLGAGFPGNLCISTGLTTADVFTLNRCLASMRAAGAKAVALEVSSHGLDQGRVNGLHLDIAVFTNLSRDHLDYHGSMANYAAAKKRLFQHPGLSTAVLNLDDPMGRSLLADLPPGMAAVGCSLQSGGRHTGGRQSGGRHTGGRQPGGPDSAAVRLLDGQATANGQQATLVTAAGAIPVATTLLGQFNLANLALVIGVLLSMGHSPEAIAGVLPRLPAVPGRMQAMTSASAAAGINPAAMVVVDYAHTPDALAQALAALRPHASQGRLICVFGCGGDRDRGKRPEMGAAAARLADLVVVTDDNPRFEDGDRIVADILPGVRAQADAATQVLVERDRAAAITLAMGLAQAGDVVLVAGKGHEDYQDIAGEKRSYSDINTVQALLNAAADSAGSSDTGNGSTGGRH